MVFAVFLMYYLKKPDHFYDMLHSRDQWRHRELSMSTSSTQQKGKKKLHSYITGLLFWSKSTWRYLFAFTVRPLSSLNLPSFINISRAVETNNLTRSIVSPSEVFHSYLPLNLVWRALSRCLNFPLIPMQKHFCFIFYVNVTLVFPSLIWPGAVISADVWHTVMLTFEISFPLVPDCERQRLEFVCVCVCFWGWACLLWLFSRANKTN